MWPFRRSNNKLGFTRDREGNLTVELTTDEQAEARKTFQMFEGYSVHKSVAEIFERGLTAFALANYAKSQAIASQFTSNTVETQGLLEKAVAAILKACSIHELPIYLYDSGCLFEMLGKGQAATDMFHNFVRSQAVFEPTQLNELFLRNRDIDEAVRDARAKLRMG